MEFSFTRSVERGKEMIVRRSFESFLRNPSEGTLYVFLSLLRFIWRQSLYKNAVHISGSNGKQDFAVMDQELIRVLSRKGSFRLSSPVRSRRVLSRKGSFRLSSPVRSREVIFKTPGLFSISKRTDIAENMVLQLLSLQLGFCDFYPRGALNNAKSTARVLHQAFNSRKDNCFQRLPVELILIILSLIPNDSVDGKNTLVERYFERPPFIRCEFGY